MKNMNCNNILQLISPIFFTMTIMAISESAGLCAIYKTSDQTILLANLMAYVLKDTILVQ